MIHHEGLNPAALLVSSGSGVAWSGSAVTLAGGQSSQNLVATNCGFKDPVATDQVQGIEVQVTQQQTSGSGSVGGTIQLVYNDQAIGSPKTLSGFTSTSTTR